MPDPQPKDPTVAPSVSHAMLFAPVEVQERLALAETDYRKAIDAEKIKAEAAKAQQAHEMDAHRIAGEENQKQRDHEAAQTEKQRIHEELQRVRNHEEAQRQRDDSHKARLTWIGAGMTVFMVVAVGVAFKADHAFGEKVLTMVGPLVAGFVGGLSLNRATAPKPLPQASDQGG